MRGEATSATYLPPEYPAVLDAVLLTALRYGLSEVPGGGRHTGLVASYDGFCTEFLRTDEDRPAPGRGLGDLRRAGVLGIDMETSTVLVVGRALGVAALARDYT